MRCTSCGVELLARAGMRPTACLPQLGRPCVVFLLLTSTWIWYLQAQAVTESESVPRDAMYVHSQADLIEVLGRPDVSMALLAGNIRLDTEGWPAQPLVRNASLLIIASPSWGDRQPLFDFNFIGNRVILSPGVVLEFRDVELRNALWTSRLELLFFSASPDATVLIRNATHFRSACVPLDQLAETLSQQPLAPGHTGPQQVWVTNGTWCRKQAPLNWCYDKVVAIKELVLSVPRMGTFGGGYELWVVNLTQVCQETVSKECVAQSGYDSCVSELQERLLARDQTWPLLLAAGKAAGSGGGGRGGGDGIPVGAVVGAVVGGTAGLVLLAASAAWLVAKRRRNVQPHQYQGSAVRSLDQLEKGLVGGRGTAAANTTSVSTSTSTSSITSGHSGPWACLLCCPGSRAKRNGVAMAGGGRVVYGTCGLAGAAGEELGAVLLRAQTRTQQPGQGQGMDVQVADIQLHAGCVLGHGSYGHVYKGTWADRTVAVKALRYSSELCHLVQREVLLCHALSHANVVGALHFVEVGPGGRLRQLQLDSNCADAHSTPSALAGAPGLGQGRQLGTGLRTDVEAAATAMQGRGGVAAAAEGACAGRQGGGGGGGGGGGRGRGGARGPVASRWDEEPTGSSSCSGLTTVARGGTGTGPNSARSAEGGGKGHVAGAAAAAAAGGFHTCHGFLVMELCDGGSLDAWRRQRWRGQGEEAVDMALIIPLALGIARGMAHIHSHGVCHGDLKLANCLLSLQHGAAIPPEPHGTPPGPASTPPRAAGGGAAAPLCSPGGDVRQDGVPSTPRCTTGAGAGAALGSAGAWQQPDVAPQPDPEATTPPAEPCGVGGGTVLGSAAVERQQDVTRLAQARDGDEVLVAKVCDFGLSRVLAAGHTHVSTQPQGTATHLAPEVWAEGHMSLHADVYAFGITLWELATGDRPWRGLTAGAIMQRVMVAGARPPLPLWAPPAFVRLMVACWAQAPKDRPCFAHVAACLEEMAAAQDLVEAKDCTATAEER